ncbi:MAG: cytochrome c peroxidase [Candidatus Pedobacter colombiensis]|uniref:Cytochrome c peroxidase n=1 Tax=Candidatus Pedobacter colombiensis TaxID=3121371 RepID=A0AAJ6BA79_9SPHI|nr:cytochrome c peroxidase [Pedobacter sp.]WEK20988.1 MAG: cytochrome c peroxidase [Pedobacter sp.]
MKKFLVLLSLSFCVIILGLINPSHDERNIGVDTTLDYFREHAIRFASSTANLQDAINNIAKDDPQSIVKAKEALKACRLQYKSIEFFLDYFFKSTSIIYNAPPNYELEEPFMEYREPSGLQMIESILFDDDPAAHQKELMEQIYLIHSSAKDLNSLLYNLDINDSKVLESTRLGLIGVMTLSITGFDAPELKTGIIESAQVLTTLKTVLTPFLQEKNEYADSVNYYLDKTLNFLEKSNEFDAFNRLDFLTQAALPLQDKLGLFISKSGKEYNATGILNYKARNLFSADALHITPLAASKEITELGKRLFFEKALSGNGSRSCASCHQEDKYFTDALPKSLALDGKTSVQRNAPTLLYVAYQHSQFWDGRAKNLNEQIMEVLKNPVEMDGDYDVIIQRMKASAFYEHAFKKAFSTEIESVNIHNLSFAISAFLQALAPFNSAFDQYLRGNHKAMNQQQIRGFNLFMGKAQCGTCHFAPVFNGLTPPLFDRTDVEVLGTTKDSNFKQAKLDADSGKYSTYPIIYFKSAFKTPTVRNIAKTGPYMHNGAFETLEQVLEFYNKGGGAGLGLDVPTQTLSAKPLNLTDKEMKDVIEFLKSLTDPYASFAKK